MKSDEAGYPLYYPEMSEMVYAPQYKHKIHSYLNDEYSDNIRISSFTFEKNQWKRIHSIWLNEKALIFFIAKTFSMNSFESQFSFRASER